VINKSANHTLFQEAQNLTSKVSGLIFCWNHPLGITEVRHLTENHLRDIYRALIAAGKTPTAVELSKDIEQMYRARKNKPCRALLIDGNPAELVPHPAHKRSA